MVGYSQCIQLRCDSVGILALVEWGGFLFEIISGHYTIVLLIQTARNVEKYRRCNRPGF